MPEFGAFDIVGPRMIGPSSSHTAGAARLGYIAWKIADRDVVSAILTLYGSFAQTGRGHGTDKALTAGVLGMQPDDENLVRARQIAARRGVAVEIFYSDEEVEHPNTAKLELTSSNGARTEVVGQSLGGGAIRITRVNGFPVEFGGEYPTLLVQHKDVPGVIQEITGILAANGINVAFMQVFRRSRGEDSYMVIETDQPVPREVRDAILQDCGNVTMVRAV